MKFEILNLKLKMRFHRFFINQKINTGERLIVSDKTLLNQWRKVLRFKAGDKVILFDGNGSEFLCLIKNISDKGVEISFIEEHPVLFKPKTDLHLIPSIIKREGFELVLEKATELGVSKIIPVISERSIKLKLNLERSRKIIIEAAEQSGKAVVPEIFDLAKLADFLASREEGRVYLALEPDAPKFSSENFGAKKIGILVGPEGGWTENEIKVFEKNKIPIVSLGEQILRAETAAIAVSSVLLLNFPDGKNLHL